MNGKFRDFFFHKLFSLRNLFFIGNFLALALFLIVLYKDFFREWKPYQSRYKNLEIERIEKTMAGSPEAREAMQDDLKHVRRRAQEVKQILVPDFHRVDRCTTCHQGYDPLINPTLTNEFTEHPYAAPANEIHKKHPPEKYGCTVCHEGQGLATTFLDAAHMPKSAEQKEAWKKKHHWEIVEFWESPMKAGRLIYASCSKCHQAPPNVPGMDIVKKGKQIFFDNGCIGCHQLNGEGGTIAPDLALETSVKPLTRIDFSNAIGAGLITKNERTLENWIRLHFATNPVVLTPGDPAGKLSADPKNPQPVAPTAMPYFGFSQDETEALVAYVTSLKTEKIPYSYFISAPAPPEPQFATAIEHGRYVFQKYGCVSCHGKDANHGILAFNKQGGRVPDLVQTVGTFTRAELVKKIQTGVNPEDKENESGPTPPLYMPSFRDRIKDKELENLVTYLMSIGKKQEAW